MTQFTDDRLAEQRDAQIQQSTEVFYRWLSKHPEIPNTEATLGAFKRYTDFSDPLVDSDFEFAWGNMKGSAAYDITTRRVPPPAEVHAQLVEDICEKLRSPDGTGAGGRYSDDNLTSLRLQMKYWSIDQLKAKLATVTSKQAQSQLSVPELKQIVRDSQPKRRFDGYPTLPAFIVPQGQIQAVKCDSAYLLGLAKNEYYEYRRMISRFGSPQISERQRGE